MLNAEQKKLIRTLGEIAKMVDEFDGVQSIAQAEAEAKSRLDAYTREAHDTKAKAEALMADAKKKSADLVASAEGRAEAITKKADTAIAEANASARDMVAKASGQADKVLGEAKAELAKLQKDSNDVIAQRDEAAAELSKVEASLAKARKAVAGLVNG